MRLTHLQVSGYRNIDRLEITFPHRTGIFIGANAQGKSNLLEAVYMLATMRAVRAETDAQVIRRESLNDVLPVARVVGLAETAEGPLKVEVTVTGRPGPNGPIGTKTAKINGVSRRHSDAVGRLTAVLFTADDLDLISGTPSGRRRYIDVTLAQVEPAYSSARSKFERVLTQRNHLLKRIREGVAIRDELPYWDGELTKHGALLFHRRARALSSIGAMAAEAHARLAPGERLTIEYRPRLDPLRISLTSAAEKEIAEAYATALATSLPRDIAAGMSLTGPHRDDLLFSLDDFAAAGFASRAQSRTVALALRLAEARYLRDVRADPPVLLLDDILSEMDAERRDSVLAALGDVDQMLVTGTDWDRFPRSFLADASLFAVEAGSVQPLGAPPPAPGHRTEVS
ncbi:MAG TPA: DNA replication and repair protein RecF [Dehalococcoidia bacterium]|nr:DNA replication and repair protein RecF [Dehalococcoidia bacterium]